jgi:predicted GNAT superfamily acetyltransferase
MSAFAKPEPDTITVRHCHGLAEFETCLDLERQVWGSNDLDVVPSAVFVVVEEVGGQVLGAFDQACGGKMVGFTLALPGFHGAERYLHSHMTAVLSEYQNRGVGRRLKLFQREDARSRGISLVEWTFDPLELRNAYFNLERLGAMVRRYLPNVYGITTSPLHGNMPTDRFVAEWWVDSPRVRAIIDAGESSARALRGASETGEVLRVPVPRNIAELRVSDREAAVRIQTGLREEFTRRFAQGFVITGIEVEQTDGVYLLEKFAPGRTPA